MIRRRRATNQAGSPDARRGSAPVPSASAPDALAAAQPSALPDVEPEGFVAEAERFVADMSARHPNLHLDFTPASTQRLDSLLAESPLGTDKGWVFGLGCYIGEVIRRNAGGAWLPDGTLAGVGNVAETFPILRAHSRFAPSSRSEHPPESLRDYLDAVLSASGAVC